jgi:Mg-chelatase subunit ChlD
MVQQPDRFSRVRRGGCAIAPRRLATAVLLAAAFTPAALALAMQGAAPGTDAQTTPAASDAGNEAGNPRTQDNVVIILDASGSMREPMKGGRRMDVAKASLLRVLENVPPTTNVGVLVFSGRNAQGSWWLAPLGPLNLPRVRDEIARLQPNGGTPLGEAMRVGADALLAQRTTQLGYGTFRLLVLTDGEATDKELVETHLPLILRRGLRLDVIGLEMKQNHSLATRVNSYRPAGSGDELAGAIAQVFAEVGSAGKDETNPELFALASSLSPDGALSVLTSLRDTSNDPLLGAPQQAMDAEQGSSSQGQPGTQSSGGSAAGPGSGSSTGSSGVGNLLRGLGIGGLVCVGAGVMVLWGVLSMAKAASRKQANATSGKKKGRKGSSGW